MSYLETHKFIFHVTGEHDSRTEPPYSGNTIYPTYTPGRNDSRVVLSDDEFRVPVEGRAEMRCIVRGEYCSQLDKKERNFSS